MTLSFGQTFKATLVLGLLSGGAYACSPAIDVDVDNSERIILAYIIYGTGFLPLMAHIWIVTYRRWTKRRTSKLVLWSTVGLSLVVIPVIFLMIMVDAGMGCGFYTVQYASYLLVFETVSLFAQFVAWRIPSRSPRTTELNLDDLS